MALDRKIVSPDGIGVALVDGNSAVRHHRQLMLRSENFDVKSYSTCAALLADPRSRDYPCIILDLEMEDDNGVELLRKMRATGWHGNALLLDGLHPGSALLRQAECHGDKVLRRDVGDQTLLSAISASIDRSAADGMQSAGE